MNIIELENINYFASSGSLFSKQGKQLLYEVSLSISKNSITGITGKSGGGKTTLAKLLAGINLSYIGVYLYNNRSITKGDFKKIQLLFQNNFNLLNPYRTVESQLKDSLLEFDNESTVQKIDEVARKVGIQSNLKQKAGTLSGGERQRSALARILLSEPEVIILDEPFSAQDTESNTRIKEIINQLYSDGRTIIVISHDTNYLEGECNSIVNISEGKINKL